MTEREAQVVVDELNAAMRDWLLPVGGGSMMLASEVRVARYQFPGQPERIGVQARDKTGWYWLLDSQIEGMLDKARTLTV